MLRIREAKFGRLYHHHHRAAVVSCGWAKASACRLQASLSCAVLCHIVSLQYLSRSSLHCLAGLPCCLFLPYGLQVVTAKVNPVQPCSYLLECLCRHLLVKSSHERDSCKMNCSYCHFGATLAVSGYNATERQFLSCSLAGRNISDGMYVNDSYKTLETLQSSLYSCNQFQQIVMLGVLTVLDYVYNSDSNLILQEVQGRLQIVRWSSAVCRCWQHRLNYSIVSSTCESMSDS